MTLLDFSYTTKNQKDFDVFFREEFIGKISKTENGWTVDKSGVYYRSKRVASLRLIVLDIKNNS